MDLAPNPYGWQSHHPQVVVQRDALLGEVAGLLRRAGRGILLGGRGLGKSVFLGQLAERLQQGTQVLFCRHPPPGQRTFPGALAWLAGLLEVPLSPGVLDTEPLLRRYFDEHPQVRLLLLLFDELDQYAGPEGGATLGRDLFNDLEIAARDLAPRLGILVAGALGTYTLRDMVSSGFRSRATQFVLEPFTAAELVALARPFADRGLPLTSDVLGALQLATGGNPALLTYGLEHLWEREQPEVTDVALIYGDFREKNHDFIRDCQRAVMNPRLSQAPRRVLSLVQRGGGAVAHEQLRAALVERSGEMHLDLSLFETVTLLRAAGLVRLDGPLHADPVQVRPIASILNLFPDEGGAKAAPGGDDVAHRAHRPAGDAALGRAPQFTKVQI